MDAVITIISLLSGLVGGNITGSSLPADKNLGALGNSIAGLIGGGAGGYILKLLGLFAAATGTAATSAVAGQPVAEPGQTLDIAQIIGNIVGSGVGGAILTAIVGFIKSATQK